MQCDCMGCRPGQSILCLGRQLLHGHLLHLLVSPGLHLAAEAGPAEHGAVRVRVPHPGDGVLVDDREGLAGDDDGVDHLPLRVVHGEHVEAAAADLLGVNHGVQEAARAVRAPHHQRGAGRHVPAEVLDDARLLLGGHAHERRQEDDVVGGQFPGDVGDVGGAERHARGERGVGAHEAARAVVGVPADVVVVEGGGGEVARGEHEGAERERAVTRSVKSAFTSGDGLSDGSLAMAAARPEILRTSADSASSSAAVSCWTTTRTSPWTTSSSLCCCCCSSSSLPMTAMAVCDRSH
uniref:Uncharacterized protein n=1 Tax=Zea mays TaxID=4577 RepID=A0A804M1U8_MAIZE